MGSKGVGVEHRGQGEHVVILRLAQGRQRLNDIPNGMSGIFHGQPTLGGRGGIVVEERGEVGGEGAFAVGLNLYALREVFLRGEDGEVVLFAVGELLGLGDKAYCHDGQVFRGHVVESEDALAIGFSREGGSLLEYHLLCLRVKDFEAGISAERLLREILDGGTQAALVTGTQEAGQEDVSHQFLAGDCLCLDICRLEVRGVGDAEELPGGEALG